MNKDFYNLTNPQKSIWLTEQFYKGTTVNNICGTVLINEIIDFEKLSKAINLYLEHNDHFRLHFIVDNDLTPKQYFSNYKEKEFIIKNLRDKTELEKFENEISGKVFDLIDNDLFEFHLFRFDNGHGGFICLFHHLTGDAWTTSLIVNRVIDIYSQLINNEEINIDTYSYKDFITEEISYLNSEKYANDSNYWNEKYNEIPEKGEIPSEKNFSISDPTAERKTYYINKELLSKIELYCKNNNISNYNFFMALFSIYISRVSSKNNFVIGSPILNRTNFKEKNIPGMFISTIPVSIQINNDLSFIEYAKNLSSEFFQNFKHQRYPYQKLLETIRQKDNSIPNLYDILISYQNAKTNRNNQQVNYEVYWNFAGAIADSLQIHFSDSNDFGSLKIDYDYKKSIYSLKDIENIHNRILYIIDQVIKTLDIKLSDIEIITKLEKDTILYLFNNTKTDFNLEKYNSIIDFIDDFGINNPSKIAIEDGNRCLTYKELIDKSKMLANYLIKKYNIKQLSNIGIITEKSINTYIGILSVLRINSTIVPIDPNYPKDRISYMLDNAKMDLIISNKSEETDFSSYPCDVIDISENNYINYSSDFDSSKYDYNLNNNLYIIFTSGSTGNPKGATISHKNMINLIMFEKYKTKIYNMPTRTLQFATMSFDVSYQEIFSSLVLGGTLIVINDSVKKDREKLTDFIIDKQIDTLYIPPKYLILLVEENSRFDELSSTLKNIICAGEQLIISSDIKKLIDCGVTIHNHYGPAETHVCTAYTIANSDNLSIKPPIGKPISNTRIYIFDSCKKIAPINCVGELYIAGDQVGNGYINNKELTESRFLEDPFYHNEKMYKTGDLAKFNEDGNIIYIGRSDFQVKVSGYRIELEEVETNILKLPYVESVMVTVVKDSIERNNLIAFIKFNTNKGKTDIKKDLSKILPNYMIPKTLYEMKKVPLNHNGKIDKKYLLNNINQFEIISDSIKHTNKPRNTLELTLLNAYKDILHNNQITIYDDFFAYGGDSLNAIALQAKCSKYNILFNTQELYDYPSVVELAKHISKSKTEKYNEPILKINYNPISVNVKKKNNIFLTGSTGYLGIHFLNELLKTDNNIYLLIRKKHQKEPRERIVESYKSYFNEDISPYLNTKIFIIDGDLSKEYFGISEKDYKALANITDIVIHCAASVKHYTSRKYNYTNNVLATNNIIDFSKNGNCLLNHISTIGITGNDLVNTNNCIKTTFDESDLYIGQNYRDNVYVETKLEAEKSIIYNIENCNLKANIYRIGNLMNRTYDLKFQINSNTNAFQNKIRAISKLRIVPKVFLDYKYDLTPVDMCSKAITKLALNNSYNNVYHIYNPNLISYKDIDCIFKKLNINLKIVDNNFTFSKYTNEIPQEFENDYKWILNDLLLDNKKRIEINSDKTQKVLEKIGFTWNVDNKYNIDVIKNIIKG